MAWSGIACALVAASIAWKALVEGSIVCLLIVLERALPQTLVIQIIGHEGATQSTQRAICLVDITELAKW